MEQITFTNGHGSISSLSERAKMFGSLKLPFIENFKLHRSNPYEADTNPDGIIDMASANNEIVTDLVTKKIKSTDLSQIPQEYFRGMTSVQGALRFRKIMARFFNNYMKPACIIEPDDIIVSSGAASALEAIGFAFLDAGEYLMIPTPYYYQFKHELKTVSQCNLLQFPISVMGSESDVDTYFCTITRESLDRVYKDALSKGLVVRLLFIINPNNPMGYIFDENTLKVCKDFCRQNGLHFVSDEVYSHCFFGENKHQSALTVMQNDGNKECDFVHVIWSFSKIFGVAGFRGGGMITKNKEMIRFFNTDKNKRISNLTLFALEPIVSDFYWLDHTFFPTLTQRLNHRREYVRNELQKKGVDCFPSPAGLYIWASFKKYSISSFDDEAKLFKHFMKYKVIIIPGNEFEEKEPGWFRIIISKDEALTKEGVRRLTQALDDLEMYTDIIS